MVPGTSDAPPHTPRPRPRPRPRPHPVPHSVLVPRPVLASTPLIATPIPVRVLQQTATIMSPSAAPTASRVAVESPHHRNAASIPCISVPRATLLDVRGWQTSIRMGISLRPEAQTVRISGPNVFAISKTVIDLFRLGYKADPFSFNPQPGVTCNLCEVEAFMEPFLDISMYVTYQWVAVLVDDETCADIAKHQTP
jgi:hypothetical protein